MPACCSDTATRTESPDWGSDRPAAASSRHGWQSRERAMRRGILGSIVALVAGAGTAWGQAAPAPIAVAGGVPPAVMNGDVIQAQAPIIMPPLSVGPPSDPTGMGPTAGFGPPPGPMYPMPGPYAENLWQPPPPGQNGEGGGYGGINRLEVVMGYGLWFAKAQPVPYPLLTTSAPSQAGILGQSSTLILAGDHSFDYKAISGLQITASWWGDDERRFGAYLDSFYTENRTSSIKVGMVGTSNGETPFDIPVLARPFIDTTTGPGSLVVGSPSIGAASALVTTSTETWGIEGSAMWNLYRTAPGQKWFLSTDLLLGYKFLELKEDLAVITNTDVNAVVTTPVFVIGPGGFPVQVGTTSTAVPIAVGGVTVTAPGSIVVTDRFTTQNLFNGTTVGLRNEIRYGMFSLDLTGKIGLGDMHQILDVYGTTTVTSSSGPTGNNYSVGSAYGGLYANASNIGRTTHDTFTVIPEVRANFGINLTQSLSAYIGYNFMYMGNVIRPGTELNPNINTTSVPLSATYGATGTAAVSHPNFTATEFWLMGVNFGMAFKY